MSRLFFSAVAFVTVVGLGVVTFQYFPYIDTHTNSATVSHIESIYLNANQSSNSTVSHSASSTEEDTTPRVPIAVYHSIRDTSPAEMSVVYQFNVPPTSFDAQLHYLHENDFHTITFAMLHEAITYGTPLPTKPVILSFDDGWRTQYTEALPILKKYGFIATFFLYPNVIEHKNYMTWDEVRTLRDAGMEIGSHSKSHQYMTKQTPEEQLYEVEQSKLILEEKLDVTITTFAYPFGLFDTNIQTMLKNVGYTTARGLGTGTTHNSEHLYELSSYLIRNDLFDFQYFVDQVQ
jgi:peptidoglycan/xylan/chitin deacetylase (PgdA/CDA1 family)